MPAPGLDFLVIGAPKAGTTSLHEYLRTHQDLFLPEAKEQQFFTRDQAYEQGWDAFARVAFRDAPAGRLLGKVSPHYLGGPAQWRDPAQESRPVSSVTAERIAATFPAVKLVAILRDPVERAISSYWQAVVLGDERRPIDDAFADELAPEALAAARHYPLDHTQYVALGEYGRLLSDYLEHFPRERLLVAATGDLDSSPRDLLTELWLYLGVSPHTPPNLGERFQTRGTGRRSRMLSVGSRIANDAPGVRHLWQALPSRVRDPLRSRLRLAAHRAEQRSKAPEAELKGRPSAVLLERLRSHFEPDLARLEELVGPVAGVTPAPTRR